MAQANPSQCPPTVNGMFNESSWDFQVKAVQEQLVLASLPAALYGMGDSVRRFVLTLKRYEQEFSLSLRFPQYTQSPSESTPTVSGPF